MNVFVSEKKNARDIGFGNYIMIGRGKEKVIYEFRILKIMSRLSPTNDSRPFPSSISCPDKLLYTRRANEMVVMTESVTGSLAAVVALLLPHLDALDGHLAVLLPGWLPLVTGVPEVALGGCGGIDPRLARNTVVEPSVCAADCDVDDEVKVLVKGSVVAASGSPWVDESGAVRVGGGEVALGPERLGEANIHDLEKTSVNVSENVLGGPLYTVGVCLLGPRGVESLALVVVLVPTVVVRIGAPVKSAADNVVATLRVSVVVATRFDNINFTGCGPSAVGVVDGQHPDGGPKPISIRKDCLYLDTSKLDGCSFLGADAARLYRVDDGAVRGVGDSNAVRPDS